VRFAGQFGKAGFLFVEHRKPERVDQDESRVLLTLSHWKSLGDAAGLFPGSPPAGGARLGEFAAVSRPP
jgi:hypothetical protein